MILLLIRVEAKSHSPRIKPVVENTDKDDGW